MNTSLANLSASQLRRAAALKDKLRSIENQLRKLLGGAAPKSPVSRPKKRKTMSKAARAKISMAQKARWEKLKAANK